MSPHKLFKFIFLASFAIALFGCAEEAVELKQKIADLEKRLQKQEKDLKEFAGKFAPPKDFSADIQRIEDQQDRISQALKTKVDPINSKLEEFRDWAQEAQKERDNVNKKLKNIEQSLIETQKRIEAESRESGKLNKELAATKKSLAMASKSLEDLTKNLADIRKEALDNNTKIVNAVKGALPKVKEMTLAEIKGQLSPLERDIANLKTAIEADRKTLAAARAQSLSPESGKDVQALAKRLRELEEIVTSQKAYLLELGSKVHEIELLLRRSSDAKEPLSSVSRR